MPAYLYDCPCGNQLEVDAGRAGETVQCPNCQQQQEIPSLRLLKQLPQVEAAEKDAAKPSRGTEAGADRQGPAERNIVRPLGVVILIFSLLILGVLGFVRYRSISGYTIDDFVKNDQEFVDQLTPLETLQMWEEIQQRGLGTRGDSYLLVERRRAGVLYVLMGMAGAVGLVGVGMIIAGGKKR